MKKYINRILDSVLLDKLEYNGAVIIEGPKWCGKSTTAKRLVKSEARMDREEEERLYELSPKQLLKGESPKLIDEWQLAPRLFDLIRAEVDERDGFGHYILTGSSSPKDIDEIKHSGAGRFAYLLMRPLSLYESGDSSGEVSLKELFDGKNDIDGYKKVDLEEMAYLIVRGGWPASISMKREHSLKIPSEYLDLILRRDLSKVDGVNRDANKAKKLLESYARNVSSSISFSSL